MLKSRIKKHDKPYSNLSDVDKSYVYFPQPRHRSDLPEKKIPESLVIFWILVYLYAAVVYAVFYRLTITVYCHYFQLDSSRAL